MKLFFRLFFFFIIATISFSQDENILIPKNTVYIATGTIVTSLGVGNMIVANVGYEFEINTHFSWLAGIDCWIFADIYIGAIGGILAYPIGRAQIEPFLGITIISGTYVNDQSRVIDIPALLGFNILINKNFGFRLQGRLYLLSLAYIVLGEVNIGVLFKY